MQAVIRDAFKAVFWSFFGVRKRSHYESDSQKLRPQHVIAAGLVSAVVFVLLLFAIVKLVTR
jgi:amino acid transporter